MDDLVFVAAMRNEVTAPLHAMRTELKELRKDVNASSAATNRLAGAEDRAGAAADRAAAKMGRFRRAVGGFRTMAAGAAATLNGLEMMTAKSSARMAVFSLGNTRAGKILGGLASAGGGVATMFKGLNTVLGTVGMSFASIGKKAVDFAVNGLRRVATAFVMVAAAAAAYVVKSGFEFTASLERTTVAMEGIFKSQRTAARVLRDVKQLALDTPFNFDQVAQGARLLGAVGVQATRIRPMLQAVSDVVAKSGGSNEQFRSIVEALAQMNSGLLNTRLLNRFAYAGIPIWDILAKKIGMTQLQLRKLVATPGGGITAMQKLGGIDSIISTLQESAVGAAARQTEATWTGVWSNFQDVMEQTMQPLLQPAFEFGKTFFKNLGTSLRTNMPLATKAIGMGKDRAGGLFLARALGLDDSKGQLFTGMIRLVRGIQKFWRDNSKDIGAFFSSVGNLVSSIARAVAPMLPAVGEVLRLFMRVATVLARDIAKGLDDLKPAFRVLGTLAWLIVKPFERLAALVDYIDKKMSWTQVFNIANLGRGGVWQAPKLGTPEAAESNARWAQIFKRNAELNGRTPTIVNPWKKATGDTGSRRAGGYGYDRRHHSRTVGTIAAASAALGGSRTLTSTVRSWGLGSLGSDHTTGRAGDVAGSNLGALAARLRADGAFAELHGSGSSRHLHTAVGDTGSSRRGVMGAGGGVQIDIGPIVIQGSADRDTARFIAREVGEQIRVVLRDLEERK